MGPTVFSDIAHRLDEFRRRDGLLGWTKNQWFAPQSFGDETFWTRYPTAPELAVMTLLAVNHGAKGITMWDYPTPSDLFGVTGEMAVALFTGGAPAAGFLIGSPRTQLNWTVPTGAGAGAGAGDETIDAAAWVDQASGQAMVSVVNLNYDDVSGPVTVSLPSGTTVSTIQGNLWGNSTWQVGPDGITVSVGTGLSGLETAVFLVGLA